MGEGNGEATAGVTVSAEPARAPFHVLAKPIGPICNIDCEYCFYLRKKDLYPGTSSFRMNEETLAVFTRQYIEAQPRGTQEVNFAWQGGEPTLMGVRFFERALELQRRYARPGMRITNALQTNGTLLNDDWGAFLRENRFLVGISVDGPRDLHDRYRRDLKGRGTFEKVTRGLEVLKAHNVEFNTLTVLQDDNSRYPKEVYGFLKQIGSTFMQFIPIVEPRAAGGVSRRSVSARRYGEFLSGLFDEWLAREDVGRIFVQDFDVLLGLVMGCRSSLCVNDVTCGRAVAIEHNGDLFSCDHFVSREDQLGNVLRDTMNTMLDGLKQTTFGDDKRVGLPRHCLDCRWLEYCNGGCPKNRITRTPGGDPGLNYLCEGYKVFYRHATPVMEKMAQCLRMGMPACEYRNLQRHMAAALRRPFPVPSGAAAAHRGPGRNAPCPCGSGKKYKKCCMPR